MAPKTGEVGRIRELGVRRCFSQCAAKCFWRRKKLRALQLAAHLLGVSFELPSVSLIRILGCLLFGGETAYRRSVKTSICELLADADHSHLSRSAMAQAAVRSTDSVEVRVRSQVSKCGICDGHTSTKVFLRVLHHCWILTSI